MKAAPVRTERPRQATRSMLTTLPAALAGLAALTCAAGAAYSPNPHDRQISIRPEIIPFGAGFDRRHDTRHWVQEQASGHFDG